MATLFRLGNLRVVIYSDDHPPPHVHVLGPDGAARFRLNPPDGPVELWDQAGFRLAELNAIGATIAERFEVCCAAWSKIHG